MRHTTTIILAIICGLMAVFAGIGLRLYLAWNTTGEGILKAVESDTQKKAEKIDESYAELLKEQGRFNILLMGEDDVEGSRRSDTILFVAIDIDDKDVRVISLPRDTRVAIPRHGMQKLNHAFAYGGPDLIRATVEKYLGQQILYYMIVDYNSFPEFVDSLGGVDIDVEKRMRYVDRAGHLNINIPAGRQHLDGETALHYVRFRKDALGDIGRVQRQQQFLKALIKKVYDPRVLIKFPEIASRAMKLFQSDMSPTLAVQLAGFIQNEVGRERIFFSMLPGEPVLIDKLSYWMGDVKAATAFLNAPIDTLFSGDLTEGEGRRAKHVDFSSAGEDILTARFAEAASADSTEGSTPTKGKSSKSSSKNSKKKKSEPRSDELSRDELLALVRSLPESVAVLNGNGKAGVSSEVSTRLQKLGVDVVHSGNAKHFDYRYSNVVFPTNASNNVKTTARQLGKLLNIPKNLVRPSRQAFYASIIAGHDYKTLVATLDKLLEISSQEQNKVSEVSE